MDFTFAAQFALNWRQSLRATVSKCIFLLCQNILTLKTVSSAASRKVEKIPPQIALLLVFLKYVSDIYNSYIQTKVCWILLMGFVK